MCRRARCQLGACTLAHVGTGPRGYVRVMLLAVGALFATLHVGASLACWHVGMLARARVGRASALERRGDGEGTAHLMSLGGKNNDIAMGAYMTMPNVLRTTHKDSAIVPEPKCHSGDVDWVVAMLAGPLLIRGTHCIAPLSAHITKILDSLVKRKSL